MQIWLGKLCIVGIISEVLKIAELLLTYLGFVY